MVDTKYNNRFLYIDALRGFAILLVIVGHLIQYNYKSGIENPIFNVIYCFHMPLFFFISGITLAVNKRKNNISLFKFIGQRLKALILPSISWTLLVPLFFQDKLMFNGAISAFWFLNVLFFIHVVDEVLTRCSESFGIIIKPILVILLASICFLLDFKRIPIWYFVIFEIGYYYQFYRINNKLNGHIMSIMVLVFLLLCGYYEYGKTAAGNPERIWLMMPLSLLASLSFIYLFSYLPDKVNMWFGNIGRRTLAIYLCHFVFVSMPYIEILDVSFTPPFQFIILLSIAFLISYLCLGVQMLIGYFPLLNLLLYGKK